MSFAQGWRLKAGGTCLEPSAWSLERERRGLFDRRSEIEGHNTYFLEHVSRSGNRYCVPVFCVTVFFKQMSWLSRLFGFVPKTERSGISLDRTAPYWVIRGFHDFPMFLRNLQTLFPEGSVLYLEGTAIAEDVQQFCRSRAVEKAAKVEMATIWPRPYVFHIALTAQNLSDLAALAEKHAEPEVCHDLHPETRLTRRVSGYGWAGRWVHDDE